MNSGNEILAKQNEDESLLLLAGQRVMYTAAKRRQFVSTVLGLGLPLALTLVQVFLAVSYEVLFVCAIAFAFLELAVASGEADLRKDAACVQQAFDACVYGVEFENTSFNRHKVLKYANKLKGRDGEIDKLRNWYLSSIAGMNPEEAVLTCQHENAEWTKRLLDRFLIFVIALAVITITAVITVIWLCRAPWQDLFFLAPIIVWLGTKIFNVHAARKAESSLVEDLETYKLSDSENIVRIQEKLYELRVNKVLIPDWFYERFRMQDEREMSS